MSSAAEQLEKIRRGDVRALARAITILENNLPGSEDLLLSLDLDNAPPVIGVTGPPGAGKSTLINALVSKFTANGQRTAVIAVDPTSPFTSGSLLGDRLRMTGHFNNPLVFIRSLATRGSLGGLSAKAVEITDLIRASGFERVIIETVGVGQSEVEIAGLADITLLVLVPESGDDIQALKSGVMEIADIYVINKADRPGADHFARNIQHLAHTGPDETEIRPIVKTIASTGEGMENLVEEIDKKGRISSLSVERKSCMYSEKAWKLISEYRMRELSKPELAKEIENELEKGEFQLYRFCNRFRS